MTNLLGLLLLVAFKVDGSTALRVDFNWNYTTYSVSHVGKELFKADHGVAVFLDCAWQTQSSGSLKLNRTKEINGFDRGLGKFHGVEIEWKAGQNDTPFVTTAKSYASAQHVVFEYSFPLGANCTSLVEHNAHSTSDSVLTNFPAFSFINLPDSFSWSGSFVQAVRGLSTGADGGPTVFFNSSDPSLSTVIVASPLNNFKASSAGPGTAFNGMKAYVPGTTGTIRSIKPGFTHKFIMHASAAPGITNAISEWGNVLQRVYNTRKLSDLTLQKVGYQTDNGAAYTFCTGNCSKTLLDKMAELKNLGINMGYLSFQGKGASTFEGTTSFEQASSDLHRGAPWCINTWAPDLKNGTSSFPLPLKQFQRALEVPIQLYAPYFCPNSPYFSKNNSTSPWRAISSNESLPGCNDFSFVNVAPGRALSFYNWLFKKGVASGMVSFESDFMNQNYKCTPDFVHSTSLASTFLHGMADAALASNVTIQWCYATPTDVLESLQLPAVTNFRVSFDYCYGNSWNIGSSSLLVWALGAVPSKDTLWTSDNNHLIVPGCSWTPDHEEPAAELHFVLALMSLGPVGISDAIGFTNANIIKRGISQDGTLLRPSKPLTTIDSLLSDWVDGGDGSIYSTYSSFGDHFCVYMFVSFRQTTSYHLRPIDFFPPIVDRPKFVFRRYGWSCLNGTEAMGCVDYLSNIDDVIIPQSNFSGNGTEFQLVVTTVWPLCRVTNWTLLGELSVYVSLSPHRFCDISCTDRGILFTLRGTWNETVPVTLLRPSIGAETHTVLVHNVHFDRDGEVTMHCHQTRCEELKSKGATQGLLKKDKRNFERIEGELNSIR